MNLSFYLKGGREGSEIITPVGPYEFSDEEAERLKNDFGQNLASKTQKALGTLGGVYKCKAITVGAREQFIYLQFSEIAFIG